MKRTGRAMLRYHGGKWVLAPWIIEHLPTHRVYVEPFGGGGSVLMRKRRSYAEVYNDLDCEIVNVFRVMQNKEMAAELERLIRYTPFSRVEFEAAHLPAENEIESARRTILKSLAGFGSNSIHKPSGFRNDANRAGTTPAHDWMNYPDNIQKFTERLQGVVIENMDAIKLIKKFDRRDTLFYVDPPYVLSTRGRKRYAEEMDDSDHERLAECLHGLKGKAVLSGYYCELYARLYHDWRAVSRSTKADGARNRREYLWISPAADTSTAMELAL